MTTLVNIDGRIETEDRARIPVLDRGFLYGDSVYEVVRTYSGRLFALAEHLDRLERSAAGLGLELPERGWLEEQTRATVGEAGNDESYCRIIVTRGSGPITLDPTTAGEPMTAIVVKRYEPFPDWTYQRGISIAIPQMRRSVQWSLGPAIKSGNYLNSVLALGEARKAGFYDALMLDTAERVTEATSSNVFVARSGGQLFTPPLEVGILSGVTRAFLIELARKSGMVCEELHVPLDDLLTADEVMITSTLREVQPVVRVGDHRIGDGRPGRTARRLRSLMRDFALRRVGAL